MMKTITLLWTLSLAILAAGAWLVCPQGQCAVTAFDRAGLGLAHALRGEILDGWMPGITWIGSLAVLLPLTALAVLLLLRRGHRREAGFLMLALLGASALSHMAKLEVLRPRPDLFPVWAAMPADWSYPSAHAMQITAAAGALLLLIVARRRALWAVPLGIIVLLVGLSRLYLQVHFPSDVLAGTLAAAFWVGGLHTLMFGRLPGHGSMQINGGRP
jgi:membrane-associated phospholipid phosphatase